MQNIQVIDNFIPTKYQDQIEDILLGFDFPWYYNKNTSYLDAEANQKWIANDPRLKDTDAFIHNFVKNGVASTFFDHIRPILDNLKVKNIFRVRGVLVPKDPSFGNFINIPHVDILDPHLTAIYYANDCDGDTVIFEEQWNGKYEYGQKTIKEKISPKKGRLVLFNGLHYHTGSVPTTNNRLLININFTQTTAS
jgi:hypothetical protein